MANENGGILSYHRQELTPDIDHVIDEVKWNVPKIKEN